MKMRSLFVVIALMSMWNPILSHSETVPVANITIDGHTWDWTGISPQYTDPEGDTHVAGHPGTDVKQIFLATNGSRDTLYFRFDFYGTPNTELCTGCADPGWGLLSYLVDFDTPEIASWGTNSGPVDMQMGFDLKRFWIWDLRGEKDYDYNHYSNCAVYNQTTEAKLARAEVVEFSFPTRYIGGSRAAWIYPWVGNQEVLGGMQDGMAQPVFFTFDSDRQVVMSLSGGCSPVGTPVYIGVNTNQAGMYFQYWLNEESYCGGAPVWRQLSEWTREPAFIWTPDSEGRKTIIAWVTDDTSSACKDMVGTAFEVGGANCIDPVSLYLRPANGHVGGQVTIYASGWRDNLQYQFWVNNKSFCTSPNQADWQLLQTWSSNNTCTWTPTLPGDYTLVVWTTDDPSNSCVGMGGMTYQVEW